MYSGSLKVAVPVTCDCVKMSAYATTSFVYSMSFLKTDTIVVETSTIFATILAATPFTTGPDT